MSNSGDCPSGTGALVNQAPAGLGPDGLRSPVEGKPWTRDAALELCRIVERIAPQFGAHIGLTGGLLYKDGPRKDCDILIYRIRQAERIDHEGLFDALATVGVQKKSGFGWCHKAEWRGMPIDFFFPEETDDGEYEGFDAEAHDLEMIPFPEAAE
jgi:hypothetical protein